MFVEEGDGNLHGSLPVTTTSRSTRLSFIHLVICCMSSVQYSVSCGMAPACVCVGGNVAAGSRAQSEEPPSLHHRVISGKSCQDHHSPEVQAKVKIKSLVKSAAR